MIEYCEKCGYHGNDTSHYFDKNNRKSNWCKACDSQLGIKEFCQKFDIPYIPEQYQIVRSHGKYLSIMKLIAYKPFGYKDSERFSKAGEW